jgi:hypothetical protein
MVDCVPGTGTDIIGGMALMAFDSGVTQEAWNFVIAVWLYPIWPIVFAIASWIAYWRKFLLLHDHIKAVLKGRLFTQLSKYE